VKKAVIVISSLVLLVVGSWLVILPEQFFIGLIENGLDSEDLHLKTEGFSKGLFLSFSAEKIVLMKRGHFRQGEKDGEKPPLSETAIVSFDDVRGKINLLSLIRFSPALDFDCTVNGGRVRGEIGLAGNGRSRIDGAGIRLQGIPLFELIGVHGDGNLSVALSLDNGKGEAKFSVDDARFKAASFGGAFVPLDLFHMAKGALIVNTGTIDLQSFALYGNGVYARIKGSVKESNLNMNLELMMDSSFEAGAALQPLLERYKVSPGYYLIPLKTAIVL